MGASAYYLPSSPRSSPLPPPLYSFYSLAYLHLRQYPVGSSSLADVKHQQWRPHEEAEDGVPATKAQQRRRPTRCCVVLVTVAAFCSRSGGRGIGSRASGGASRGRARGQSGRRGWEHAGRPESSRSSEVTRAWQRAARRRLQAMLQVIPHKDLEAWLAPPIRLFAHPLAAALAAPLSDHRVAFAIAQGFLGKRTLIHVSVSVDRRRRWRQHLCFSGAGYRPHKFSDVSGIRLLGLADFSAASAQVRRRQQEKAAATSHHRERAPQEPAAVGRVALGQLVDAEDCQDICLGHQRGLGQAVLQPASSSPRQRRSPVRSRCGKSSVS